MTENSPTILSKVLAILNGLDDAAYMPSSNRRQRPRVMFRHEMIAMLLGVAGEVKVQIYTRNLSTSGLGFLCRRPFQEGDQFVLPIQLKGTPSKMVLCRVTFVYYTGNGMHEIGAEFEKAVPDPKNEHIIPREWIFPIRNPRMMTA